MQSWSPRLKAFASVPKRIWYVTQSMQRAKEMIMRTIRGIAALVLFCLFGMAGVGHAGQVFLKDGSILECESFWRSGNDVFVKVNRDVVVPFSKDEIDLKKTLRLQKKKTVKHVAPAKHAVKAEPKAAIPAQPTTAEQKKGPAPKAAAQPATTAATTAPAKPTAQQPTKPGKPVPAPTAAKPAPTKPQPVKPLPAPLPPPLKERQEMPPAPPGMANLAAMSSTVLYLAVFVILALTILVIAGNWKVFEKAGVAGWKCLIPIYNLYLLIVIAGKPWWWLILMFIPIVSVVIYLLAMLALAERFGKGPLFGVGLFFLPIIFFPLLGFDSSEYRG